TNRRPLPPRHHPRPVRHRRTPPTHRHHREPNRVRILHRPRRHKRARGRRPRHAAKREGHDGAFITTTTRRRRRQVQARTRSPRSRACTHIIFNCARHRRAVGALLGAGTRLVDNGSDAPSSRTHGHHPWRTCLPKVHTRPRLRSHAAAHQHLTHAPLARSRHVLHAPRLHTPRRRHDRGATRSRDSAGLGP